MSDHPCPEGLRPVKLFFFTVQLIQELRDLRHCACDRHTSLLIFQRLHQPFFVIRLQQHSGDSREGGNVALLKLVDRFQKREIINGRFINFGFSKHPQILGFKRGLKKQKKRKYIFPLFILVVHVASLSATIYFYIFPLLNNELFIAKMHLI